jgi:hypothetical protein
VAVQKKHNMQSAQTYYDYKPETNNNRDSATALLKFHLQMVECPQNLSSVGLLFSL